MAITSTPASPFSLATSASAAALPMAVVGTTVVVSRRGSTEAASIPPQPMMPRSPGTEMPRAVQ